MSLNTAVSFLTMFHTITRVFFGDPGMPTAEVSRVKTVSQTNTTLAEPFNDFWFGDANAPGAIALGMAEGTRTINGVRTSAWHGHTDPGNANYNVGTFSSQHTDLSPDRADAAELERIREKLTTFIQAHPNLSPLEYLSAADLSIQARGAFPAFGMHLKGVDPSRLTPVPRIVEARVLSFYNPANGRLEAGGFGNDEKALRRDQLRRTRELERKIRDVKVNTPEAMTIANRR